MDRKASRPCRRSATTTREAPIGPKMATSRSVNRTGRVGSQLGDVAAGPARCHARNARAHQNKAMAATPTSLRTRENQVNGSSMGALAGAAQAGTRARMAPSVVQRAPQVDGLRRDDTSEWFGSGPPNDL